MRKACFVVALTAFALACNAAWATRVTINGTYSRSQVKKDCDAVGGSCDNCTGKSGGYSCSNLNNNNTVYCLSNGRCTGWIPGRSRPPHTLGGILHAPAGVKTTGGVTGGRHMGHGRVIKAGGLKTKAIYRSHPTDSGGKGLTGYRSTGPTFPNSTEHHNGRHR